MSKQAGRSIVLVATLLAVLIGCTQTRTQKTAGEQIDDTVITTRVKSALLADDAVKGTQVDVEVFRGIVQLNGFVDNPAAKQAAAEVARKVDGVTEVRNNLQIRTQERSAGDVVDDSAITAKVKAALAGDNRTSAFQINVETRSGVVQLNGFVDNAEAKQAAAEVARQVAQVASVDNNLEVKQLPGSAKR